MYNVANKNLIWKEKESACFSLANNISKQLNISNLTASLLCARGYDTVSKAKAFLCSDSNQIHDPYLIPDMDKAVSRLANAIQNKEKVMIYGDYDVDGVSSVSLLYLFLCSKGVDACYYIPDRISDGYGINKAAIDKIAEKDISLIISVDTGVTAVEECEYAKTKGIEMIITDHHECHEKLPDAVAVVNPCRHDSNYPFPKLAGVGVVFKFLCAFEDSERSQKGTSVGIFEELCANYIDLVAVGTIADVMPMEDENRIFVKMGLRAISENPRLGVRALLEMTGSIGLGKNNISSSTIGYTLAPRINAAGRIDSAERAVGVFLAANQEQAYATAELLCSINKQRQNEENRIINEAFEMIEKECDLEKDKVIVLAKDNWHQGVIGIVASRITEKFGLPSILISFDGNVGKGSGRSIKGINLVEALTACSQHTLKYGGHELAAGLSVSRDDYEGFVLSIKKYMAERIEKAQTPTLEIDMAVSTDDLTLEQAEEISMLEPFGVSNNIPVFSVYGVKVNDISSLSGKHTRILIEAGNSNVQVLLFSVSRGSLDIYTGDRVDIVFTMSVNEYRQRRKLQLIAKDIKISKDSYIISDFERNEYERIINGGKFSRADDYLPSRDDFAVVYRYLKNIIVQNSQDCIGMRQMITALYNQYGINYVKLKIILSVMEAEALITLKEFEECKDNLHITLNFVKNKVSIERSPLYLKIRSAREDGTQRKEEDEWKAE